MINSQWVESCSSSTKIRSGQYPNGNISLLTCSVFSASTFHPGNLQCILLKNIFRCRYFVLSEPVALYL
ncbi:hypothetical protein T10_5373 [Trichinella papuae]|uniref:Uncharacterized protein n=1 Tax=Trichinella papuae TaxID=268474 RepID=A0A0V1M3A8_9BILA|nr:hypothetical protein T10_4397 [Trichinella papuae]KRZ65996.1 hypothetical protein T10_5373 [Trichinella papuae]